MSFFTYSQNMYDLLNCCINVDLYVLCSQKEGLVILDSDVDPSNLTHKHETHNKDGEISVHDNHSMQGNYTKNETDF